MATSNDSMTEGLAQIAQEEAQFSFGGNRYFLGIVSFGLILGGLYLVITNYDDSHVKQLKYWSQGPFLMLFGVLFACGAWRANIIYKKLKALNPKADEE